LKIKVSNLQTFKNNCDLIPRFDVRFVRHWTEPDDDTENTNRACT